MVNQPGQSERSTPYETRGYTLGGERVEVDLFRDNETGRISTIVRQGIEVIGHTSGPTEKAALSAVPSGVRPRRVQY